VKVLYVDDRPEDVCLVRDALESAPTAFVVTEAMSQEEFDTCLSQWAYDVVLTDLDILGFTGFGVIDSVRERGIEAPTVVITGKGSEEIAAEAIKRGAADYVIKTPAHIKQLPHTIQAVLERSRLAEEHEHTNVALAESERYYRALMHSLHEDLLVIDPTYSIVDVNNSVLVTTGKTREDVVGRPCFTVSHGHAVPCHQVGEQCQLSEVFETGKACECAHVHLRGDGSRVHLDIRMSPLVDASGHVTHVVEAMRDVTDLLAAESKMRESEAAAGESEAKFRDLYEQSPDSHFNVDPTSGRVLGCNDTAAAFLGYRKDEIIGMSVHDLYHADCARQVDRALRKFAETGELSDVELVARRYNGEKKHVSLTARAVYDDEGRIKFSRSSWRDIAERKKANQELLASKERLRRLASRLTEVREQERTNIARELHDEMGQKLTGIRIDLDAVRSVLAADHPDLAKRINAIAVLVDEATEETQDLSTRLRPPMLDVLGLTAAIEWYVRDFEKRSGIECGLDLADEKPELDDRSATAVFRILQEALTNVARHANAGTVLMRMAVEEAKLVLEVTDDGVGITEEQQLAPRSLGLIGMRERADALGGKVEVGPGPDGGTRLRMVLPVE